jgi:hypothetical protein
MHPFAAYTGFPATSQAEEGKNLTDKFPLESKILSMGDFPLFSFRNSDRNKKFPAREHDTLHIISVPLQFSISLGKVRVKKLNKITSHHRSLTPRYGIRRIYILIYCSGQTRTINYFPSTFNEEIPLPSPGRVLVIIVPVSQLAPIKSELGKRTN